MALVAFVAPILPGKTEQWKRFAGELLGTRGKEYKESRQRYGIWEHAFLQSTPQGDMVVVTLDGDDPTKFLEQFANSGDPFSRWFVQQVKEIHGFDLTQMSPTSMPTLVVDSGRPSTMPMTQGKGMDGRTVVRRFLEEVITAGKGGSWNDLTAPSYRNFIFGSKMDRKASEQMVKSFHSAFPDFRIAIDDMIVEGDKVVCQLTIHGTHRGDFQGIAPTGKKISIPGVAIFRVENGKIVEDRPVFDQMLMMQQLGVMQTQQRKAA